MKILLKVQKGSVIAGVSGVWSETELKKIWGNDIGAAKLPTYTVAGKQVQMASFTGYKLMGVSAYSANPQWAAKLADWLTNEQNQTVRFEMNGQDLPIQRQRIRMRLRLLHPFRQ